MKKYSKIYKYINFILLIIIKISNENYITIPFQVIFNNEPDNFTSLNDYFKFWYDIPFYGQISVGTPPQKIIAKLSFEDYGISVLNKGCNYNIQYKEIDSTLNLQN